MKIPRVNKRSGCNGRCPHLKSCNTTMSGLSTKVPSKKCIIFPAPTRISHMVFRRLKGIIDGAT